MGCCSGKVELAPQFRPIATGPKGDDFLNAPVTPVLESEGTSFLANQIGSSGSSGLHSQTLSPRHGVPPRSPCNGTANSFQLTLPGKKRKKRVHGGSEHTSSNDLWLPGQASESSGNLSSTMSDSDSDGPETNLHTSTSFKPSRLSLNIPRVSSMPSDSSGGSTNHFTTTSTGFPLGTSTGSLSKMLPSPITRGNHVRSKLPRVCSSRFRLVPLMSNNTALDLHFSTTSDDNRKVAYIGLAGSRLNLTVASEMSSLQVVFCRAVYFGKSSGSLQVGKVDPSLTPSTPPGAAMYIDDELVGQAYEALSNGQRARFELDNISSEYIFSVVGPVNGPSRIKWRKGKALGKGATAAVYLALNLTSGVLMAAKVINTPINTAENRASTMESEVEMLTEFRHANIVGYYGTEYHKSQLVIFLEYVPGGSIASLLQMFGPLPEAVVRTYLRQILLGLGYLHASGVLHKDIKGANILVTEDGEVKLADFGTAVRPSQDGTDSARLVGTVPWMAPEVARGMEYSPASDIWSVGCTVIEMLSGKPPWIETNITSVKSMLHFLARVKTGPSCPSSSTVHHDRHYSPLLAIKTGGSGELLRITQSPILLSRHRRAVKSTYNTSCQRRLASWMCPSHIQRQCQALMGWFPFLRLSTMLDTFVVDSLFDSVISIILHNFPFYQAYTPYSVALLDILVQRARALSYHIVRVVPYTPPT
eukprot:NODE_515_length_2381_cov_86.380868_g489_i0.p1 GENE.NODE_515_length_2381_cov_86.380868_g489_i0~~NODE_515_length_2381_cov_86.380868_g489_i0.p1  ORF type:complete len:703 (-),score=84.88 NODE_515_length_2381_cov_86.380868_g489_i0:176-2284(-)